MATTSPAPVDIDYQIEHFMEGPLLPDREYFYRRISEATVATVNDRAPGSVVDVGCGASRELARLSELNWRAYAVDPSTHMLGFSRLTGAGTKARIHLIRAIGERLPFADGSVDVVATQCALDHFSDRSVFMAEAARVVRDDGRVIVSLSNFEGLSCRLGRFLHPIARFVRLHHCADDGRCWAIPPDHTFKGDWTVVRSLGGSDLVLERAYGIGLLTMFYGWGHLLDHLPRSLAWRLLRIADWFAYRWPAGSDVIVSVWGPARSRRPAGVPFLAPEPRRIGETVGQRVEA